MRKKFRNIQGVHVDEIDYTLDVLKAKPGAKVYIGTDSQKRARRIEYATVIAYRYGHRGAHFIFYKWTVPRKGYGKGDALIQRRLLQEVQATMETAQRLQDHSIQIHQIDFDLNGDPKWKSHMFVQMAVGWAASLGFRVSIKPDEQIATKAANNLVNG